MLAFDVAPPAGIDAEIAEVARKALERSDQPLSVAQIRQQLSGPFRKRADGLEAALDSLVEQGQAFRLPKYGRTHRYWDRDLESYARQVIVQTLARKSLTRSELTARLKIKLGDLSEARRKALLDELLREGRVRELPPYLGGRTKRLTSGVVDPGEYVADALQKIANALAKVGISRDEVVVAAGRLTGAPESRERGPERSEPAVRDQESGVRSEPDSQLSTLDSQPPPAAPGVNLEQVLLERMVEIEPAARQGAMVYVPELRRALDFQPMNPEDFGRAVWGLVHQGRLAVHRHGHPTSLEPAERAALVTDERGNYYHGVSLRTE